MGWSVTFMNPFLLISACSEYQFGAGDFTEEEPLRSETQDPSADFPLLDACADLGFYLPGLDSQSGNNFYEICPLDMTTDTYSADTNGRVAQCTGILDSRAEKLTSQATSLFWNDIDVAALLNCEIPLTVFTAITREEVGTGDEAMLTEATQTWVTFDYHKEDDALILFETEGLVDAEGEPTEQFPVDALYLSNFHERPLSEFSYQETNRDNARTVGMSVAVLPIKEIISGDNSLGFNFSYDGLSWMGLDLSDNVDADDGEKLSYTSVESVDYSLSTLRTTIPEFVDPLTESLANFCGLDTDFRGTEYCVKYFSHDEG